MRTPTPAQAAEPSSLATAEPSPALAPSPSPPPEEPEAPPPVTGFIFPLAGACLPTSDNLLPNAPRPYRAGIHEGIDFYDGLACAAIAAGTPVLAAKAGTVVRADWDYQEITAAEMEDLLTASQEQGYTDAESLDRFRGRQVWIDHGGGIVTRYAHLAAIAAGLEVGSLVEAGQVIGYVGNSGTPEGVSDPNAENHLHFEIRIGDSYLGQGLPVEQVRALLQQAFSGP